MEDRLLLPVCMVLLTILSALKIDCRDAVLSDCHLNLQKDFGSPTPVFLQDGLLMAPNRHGEVMVPRGDSVVAACPGEHKLVMLGNYTSHVQDAIATCFTNTTFKVGSWKGEFRDIHCSGLPWFVAEDQEACFEGSRLYRIGYKIGKIFHKVYEACFDHNALTTLYVKHHLTAVSKYNQGGRRPQFVEGGLFGDVKMSELYKTKNQKIRLNQVLGEDMDKKYFSKNQFLTRGHLAPRADFSMRAVQRASFHYANAAPQWRNTNAGDWAALEDALRRRVQKMNSSLTVYTGVYGVLRLKTNKEEEVEFYLSVDSNNNNVVPVPMYFYKVVYNQAQKTAVAFVTINSSFYTRNETQALTFCCDVCDNYAWLRWRNDGSHSFCCSYEEFVKKVRHLPKLEVVGLFV